MALQFALGQDAPAFLVLDAFFSTAGVFRLARSVYSMALRQPYLVILTRPRKITSPISPQRPSRPTDRDRNRAMARKSI